jgi:hypothetical protein
MPDPGSIPMAEMMSSASSVMILLLAAALLLVLWQVAILLGALIASLWRRQPEDVSGELRVG